ncbi:type II toxin-antitoxin system RatA family toxin [Magnetospira sp. QH-2]|uniref:type II toxin-antitoxin system RatA family toxin n=1 Tax=Magnetospira sp. (strain QH-2) TaxID=1288970 RepID=UPI0003E812F9|nr:type II toxin-antitoxin system RatA family toxin [Magnetospira sp. QH-2]CCQ73142.1 Putative cyclase/dehydrase [Magnetospira sp. QH-2]
MIRIKRNYRVAQKVERLFDVAADFESYPEFLPNCLAMRVIEQTDENFLVDNLYRWGPVTTQFRSRTHMERPHRLDVKSVDRGTQFSIGWRFVPDGPEATQVTFTMEVDLNNRLLRGVVEAVLQTTAQRIESAFRARVDQIFGGTGSSSTEI